MNTKSTIKKHSDQLPAGVDPYDHNIEFVGNKETMTVIWFQHGNAHHWDTLPNEVYKKMEELLFSDQTAMEVLCNEYESEAHDVRRMVEIYTCYIYGDLDNIPDIDNGVLAPSENFRRTKTCFSLKFKNKSITINGHALNDRDLRIIDMILEDFPDKLIAHNIGISQSTFDFHKRNLSKRIQAKSKVDIVIQAFKNQIPC